MQTVWSMAAGALLTFFSILATAAGQELKVEKYQLPNGMTVILHEDHSLPVACINTWYYVGSKDEPPGRSGFAHLFEHLMFMGTRRVPGSDFDFLMESGGGSNNASTEFLFNRTRVALAHAPVARCRSAGRSRQGNDAGEVGQTA